MKNQDKQNSNVTFLEWVEITQQNISKVKMETFFKQLEPVYISAFTELEKASMQEQHPKEYQEMLKNGETIEKLLGEYWQIILGTIKTCLEKKLLENIPCAVIKNTKNDILGFSIFWPLQQKVLLPIMQNMGFIKQIQWAKEHKEETNLNEVYVRLLAVRHDYQGEGCQGKGYGKKLLFSILSHDQHIKKMYLGTDASKTNEIAQGFYEHCGFECTATYINGDNDQIRIYEFDRK
jgi:ribosomal protein S18 acetylase RimI-like enzyme